ncbi:DUF6907 domain-containing protein [Streptomyces lincolnensis]|uniref:DUF6907 domain-containing protein n=1 Tax=Streptomyces lincolnensis TaxID=1915 RepID=UPI0037D76A1B
MQNRKAEAAGTARLVDTDETPATFRARPAETGAGHQQRARADQLSEDSAREYQLRAQRHESFPGFSIVSALVKGIQVPIACPTAWCTENHADEENAHLEDIDHSGEHVDVYAPRIDKEDMLFAFAHLSQDPLSARAKERVPYVVVEGDEAMFLTPDQADTFATNLTTFSGRIRDLSRTARGLSEEDLLTPAQSTLVPDDGLGGWLTAPVETAMRDIDANGAPGENERIPFLAVKVAVLDYRSQAYGRTTEVWLDYGRVTAGIPPAKAREVLTEMREFCDRFEAVIKVAEESVALDFEGDAEIARLDEEAEDRRIKAITDSSKGVA